MPNRLSRPIRLSLLTLTLLATAAAPAFAGPPWISIELPANPSAGDPMQFERASHQHVVEHALLWGGLHARRSDEARR